MADEYDLVGLAIELANEAIAIVRDGDGSEDNLRSCFACLIEAERDGLPPAAGELDAIIAEINQNQSENYWHLCDANTRLPIFQEAVYAPADLLDPGLSERGLEWIAKSVVEREEREREAAEQAAENAKREANRTRISDAEAAALIAYASANGTQWKKRLRKELAAGELHPVLTALMNHPRFGDIWLTGYKLPRGFQHRKGVAA